MKFFDVFIAACKEQDLNKVEEFLEGLEAYQSDFWGDGRMHIGRTAPTYARQDIPSTLLTDPISYYNVIYEVSDSSAIVTLRLGLKLMTGIISVFPNEEGKIVGLVAMQAELAANEKPIPPALFHGEL